MTTCTNFVMSYWSFFLTPLAITGILCLQNNSNSVYLFNVGTVLSALHVLTHLIFTVHGVHIIVLSS